MEVLGASHQKVVRHFVTFQELLKEIQKFRLKEKRAYTEDYLEVVIPADALSELRLILTGHFGEPLKWPGKHSSKEADHYSKPYGGIQRNQTLYFRKGEQGHELVLLWPWGNGTLITLKIIQEKK